MPGSRATVGLVGLVALLLGGCGDQSGQTGSMACAPNISVACAMLTGTLIVEVETLEVNPAAQTGTFEVVASVNPSPIFNEEDKGMKLTGPYTFFPLDDAHESLGDAREVQVPPIGVGDHLIAAFWESDYVNASCPGFADCTTNCT